MAALWERNGKYNVIYNYVDEEGNHKQKWETFRTLPEAKRRKVELEYKKLHGTIVIPNCRTLEGLLEEYVTLYRKLKAVSGRSIFRKAWQGCWWSTGGSRMI